MIEVSSSPTLEKPPHFEYGHVSEELRSNLNTIDRLTFHFLREIENGPPAKISFGLEKYSHMQLLVNEALKDGEKLGLNDRETQLLAFVCRAHDIGRHIEAVANLDTLRPGVRHGKLSREWLEQNVAHFDSFSSSEWESILSAVQYHSERDFVGDELAQKLCFYLKDLDKIEILEKGFVTDTKLIARELQLHYLKRIEHKSKAMPFLKGESLHNIIQKVAMALRRPVKISSMRTASDLLPSSQNLPVAMNLIDVILGRGLLSQRKPTDQNPSEPLPLQNFLDGKLIHVADIKYSWATYTLLHLAMIFDIKSSAILEKIFEERVKYLAPRLRFLRKRIPKVEYEAIVIKLANYFAENLPNASDAKAISKMLHFSTFH